MTNLSILGSVLMIRIATLNVETRKDSWETYPLEIEPRDL